MEMRIVTEGVLKVGQEVLLRSPKKDRADRDRPRPEKGKLRGKKEQLVGGGRDADGSSIEGVRVAFSQEIARTRYEGSICEMKFALSG